MFRLLKQHSITSVIMIIKMIVTITIMIIESITAMAVIPVLATILITL